MRPLLSHPAARRLVASAGLCSLADWIVFAALVAVVHRATGGSAFAVAIVTVGRILPSVVLGPLVATRVGGFGLRRTLVAVDVVRAAAVLAIAAAPGAPALVGVILAFELAAAVGAATREAAISTSVPRHLFPELNTATGVLAYGLLPVGGAAAALSLRAGAAAPFVLAAAAYAASALVVGGAQLGGRRPTLPTDARPSALAGLAALRAPGALRDVVAVAAVGVLAVAMVFSVAPAVAERVLGDSSRHGLLLCVIGAGALVGALRARRGAAATSGLATATLGTGLVAGPRPVAMVGLVLLGAGAAVAYVATQTRLQSVASGPEQFAAAFAVLKVATIVALIAAPVLATAGGVGAVVAAAALASAAGTSACGRLLDRRGPLSALLVPVGRAVVRAAVRIRIEGALPAQPAVLVSNHPSYLDGPLAMALDARVRPIAKPQRHPIARLGIAVSGALLTGTGATAGAVDHLRRGGLVWLAPEGRRNAGPLSRPRTGAARMAAEAAVPVVPLALRYETPEGPRLRDWRPWRRPAVTVVVGEPIPAHGDPGHVVERAMDSLSGLTGLPRDGVLAAAA